MKASIMSTEQQGRVSHTPGPWRVSRVQSWGVETPTGDIVRCYGPNADANARLVAAAPELLSIAQKLLDHASKVNTAFYVEGTPKAMKAAMVGQRELLQEARQAIAKATNP